MDFETSVLALGFDGYLVALALVARQDIARFGPPMVLGIVAGLAALVCGEIAVLDRWESLGVAMALASVASFGFIAYALWTRRRLLWSPENEREEQG